MEVPELDHLPGKFYTFYHNGVDLNKIDRPREVETVEEFLDITNFSDEKEIFVTKSVEFPVEDGLFKKGLWVMQSPHKTDNPHVYQT